MTSRPGVGLSLRVPLVRQPGGQGLPVPSPATAGSAGCDLSAAIDSDLELAPGARRLIPTGFAIALPGGYEAQIRPRSGLALRHGIVLPNAPGTIDSDYRGEIQVILLNAGEEPFTIRRGDRIAQLVIAPVLRVAFDLVDALDPTDRGSGGFGHTGHARRDGAQASQAGAEHAGERKRGPRGNQ